MQVLIISSTKRKTRFNIVQQNGKGKLLYDKMNHIVVVFSVFTFNKQSTISANCTVNGVLASYVTATATRGDVFYIVVRRCSERKCDGYDKNNIFIHIL